jgi:hypothetical protein
VQQQLGTQICRNECEEAHDGSRYGDNGEKAKVAIRDDPINNDGRD